MRSFFAGMSTVDKILYPVSAAALAGVTLLFGGSALSLTLCLCGLAATLLNTKGKRVCYALYLAQAVLYGYVAVRNRFYGEAAINLLYAAPVYIRALWLYARRVEPTQKTEAVARIRTLPKSAYWLLAAGTAVLLPVYGWALSLLGTACPYGNAASACVYIATTWLVAKRYIEQWVFWNVYTLIQLALWLTTFAGGFENIPIVCSNAVYLIINTQAFCGWRRLLYPKQTA